MPEQHKYGTTRSYGRALLFSICTFGLYYIFYYYNNFKDLEEHYVKANKTEPKATPTSNSPGTMILLMLCGFGIGWIYGLYKKYALLHEHLETTPKKYKETQCPSPISALLSMFCGACTLYIWPLLIESKWQKAFNEHILKHGK